MIEINVAFCGGLLLPPLEKTHQRGRTSFHVGDDCILYMEHGMLRLMRRDFILLISWLLGHVRMCMRRGQKRLIGFVENL